MVPKSSQHSAEFPIVCLIWYARFQSSAMFNQHDIRWCGFRWSIPLSIGYVWHSGIDMAILTFSCSYCIYNRYWENHRNILPNFLLFAWFDTLEFNRLLCSNNAIYDDADFADRFRYQLAMLRIRVLIWLSWLLHAHIAYNRWCQNHRSMLPNFVLFAWFYTVNSIVGDVQTTRCTMIWLQWSILISIDYVWSVYIHAAISTPW